MLYETRPDPAPGRGEVLPHKERRRPLWLYGLPLKMWFRARVSTSAPFRRSPSAPSPVLSTIMGVGGGFIRAGHALMCCA
jgi:hypothetical protein